MKRTYSPPLSGIALALTLVLACTLSDLAWAQARALPSVSGHYRGLFQSIGDPNVRGPVELTINFQDPPDPDFSGSLMLGSMLPFTFRGKVDADGLLKFTGRGPAGSVTGTGRWQDLTRGGALSLASYKFTPTAGPVDQGNVRLLRGFQDPPEPESPPDISGSWRGTFESGLTLVTGAGAWTVQQDRSKSGAPGTAFSGQESLDMGPAGIIINDFVGTIDGLGNLVRVGLSARGFVICGSKVSTGLVDPPVPDVHGHGVLDLVHGGIDLISLALTR